MEDVSEYPIILKSFTWKMYQVTSKLSYKTPNNTFRVPK